MQNRRIFLPVFLALVSVSFSMEHFPIWLQGNWSMKKGSSTILLTLALAGDSRLIGSELILKGEEGRLVHAEQIEIRETPSGMELEVFPLGQASLIMRATEISEGKIVFENPEHDFPKVWSFELNESQGMSEIASGDGHVIRNDFSRIQ